ncbi:MAG: hypothetical protein ACTIKB_10340, partial [Agrococcus casei]|uniref:hypothetical protein n=1 Tax=Agrococcus casei TaxID=343512 RepID=UPI003F987E00
THPIREKISAGQAPASTCENLLLLGPRRARNYTAVRHTGVSCKDSFHRFRTCGEPLSTGEIRDLMRMSQTGTTNPPQAL